MTYTYTENGYTRKRKDSYKGPDSYDMKECYIDDKGTYHEVELEYEDGEKDYGHKRSLTSDGIEFIYYWSYEIMTLTQSHVRVFFLSQSKIMASVPLSIVICKMVRL